MKVNKNLTKLLAGAACLFVFCVSAEAQRRTKTTTPPKPKVVTTSTVGTNELKTGAEKVSIQIKNLTKFIFVLGGVAKGIEDLDKEIKAGKVSREIADKNTQFKQDLITSIKNIRAGIVQLEIEFRTKSDLKKFTQILDSSTLCYQAEDQAVAGRFNDSGKTLLLVIEKLADTLAAMP